MASRSWCLQNTLAMCMVCQGTLVTQSWLRLSKIYCGALKHWSQICITCLSYWFLDMVSVLCWGRMPRTQGMAAGVLYRAFCQPKFECGCKMLGFRVCHLQHIKESLMVTILYIRLIINTSIVTNVFPKSWKHSIIIPIHKSGDIEEPTNFRPINLL